ncbi:hypothetical protein AAD018_017285 [Aestuariibius insulae]|uniref:hypothetical protein n=1 Tax=Aestuariibius insulae TaxID=2058287 RepID=UPI00345E2AC5
MVDNNESIARLLFSDDMVKHLTGQLTPASFPTEELLEKPGRDGTLKSVSVDRCEYINPLRSTLEEKAKEIEKPERDRARWGFAVSEVSAIREILTSDKMQVYDVFPDPIENGKFPEWDLAHAKLVRAAPTHTRSLVRGSRDKLISLFQENMYPFEPSM